MATFKDLQKFSLRLNVLYVEDNDSVREETAKVFKPFFAHIDLANNGKAGLDSYNNTHYDIVITDINMPVMNGIEMIERIREINPEQKIIAISAHDEPVILMNLMRKGISSFILKPLNLNDMLTALYPVCRDADAQKENIALFETLQEERKQLKTVVRMLTSHLHTVAIKNEQLGDLYAQTKPEERSRLLEEYFAKDEDQGDEKVVLIQDDCEEITDLLNEIPEELSLYVENKQIEHIHRIRDDMMKISAILFHYSPFLDPLAEKLGALAHVIAEENDFIALLNEKADLLLRLFDAVCIDLRLYVKRFSTESMAMKNIHHIHQPTSLSIQQIIGLIHPDKAESGDIEFF
ncbi:MAG: response regulator [Sulfuricurvum sp.]|uniref:response regulator n=1 Tax=Sulfuricurvum sp. TaxID=2025608 RepID=UPI00260B0602|nr:response regulator [Sulfuricurvum sp.]MDD2368930.1 response regulator [Sulfuricurvum sp.]MDD5118664.1 response regulator [Sulfuricurvum sp.]